MIAEKNDPAHAAIASELAAELNMDPLEVREKNWIKHEEFPYTTVEGLTYDSGNYPACFDGALKKSDYAHFPARQAAARKEGRYLGIGIANAVEATGLGPYESATVRVSTSGRISIYTGATPQGQSHKTVLAQIAADQLGVSYEDIDVVTGDTNLNALGMGTFAAQANAAADPLAGKIYGKDHSQYEIFRRGATWNARKPNRFPNAIVLAESDKDVVAAVKLAKERGWQVGTRSGGHSFTGSHTRDNAVLINISKMKELKVDTKARTAVASPGWFGDELNKELAKDQLIATTAHDPKVGIGGFFMCGGHSTIGRMYGPACANLLAADVVTADGELIHVDDKQNTDYFWIIGIK